MYQVQQLRVFTLLVLKSLPFSKGDLEGFPNTLMTLIMRVYADFWGEKWVRFVKAVFLLTYCLYDKMILVGIGLMDKTQPMHLTHVYFLLDIINMLW